MPLYLRILLSAFQTSKHSKFRTMSTTPSLVSSPSLGSQASEPVELAYTPTWPLLLPPPNYQVTHLPTHPNVYLHLLQILKWEIWTHSQTRAKLQSECMRSAELADQVNRLSSKLSQLQELYRSDQNRDQDPLSTPRCHSKLERKVCAATLTCWTPF